MKSILVAVAVLVSGIAGCAAEQVGEAGYGEGLGTPESPVPHDGSYAVTSRINITSEMAQVQLAVAELHAFSQNPARTLLAEAEQAGLPALQQLNSALSPTLRSQLEGWINAEIDKARLAGKTPRQLATELAAIAQTTLTQFTVESSLSITPGKALHMLTQLQFTPMALDISVPIGGLSADILIQRPTADVTEGGKLTLGDQRFGLALGSHAWQGINLASTQLFGSDLHTTLIKAVNCPALAQAVSTKCSGGSCVGNASLVRAVCEGSVDALVGELREHVPSFELDVFRLVQGSARLVDNDLDGIAERIVDGTWETETKLAVEVRRAPAMFTATR